MRDAQPAVRGFVRTASVTLCEAGLAVLSGIRRRRARASRRIIDPCINNAIISAALDGAPGAHIGVLLGCRSIAFIVSESIRRVSPEFRRAASGIRSSSPDYPKAFRVRLTISKTVDSTSGLPLGRSCESRWATATRYEWPFFENTAPAETSQ